MKQIKVITLTSLFLLIAGISIAQSNKSSELWYTKPAEKWSAEALPIGNGRMGAMFFGGVNQEKIQFNEQSLWSGDNNWDGEYETGDHGFGSYRNFGEININFGAEKKATGYTRSLDISNGIHSTEFDIAGITYKREAFASYPDQVMVFRYTASKAGKLSGSISLTSAQGAIAVAISSTLTFSGEMPNKLKYAAQLRILNDGGKVKVQNDDLVFENCNSFTLLLDARTNYKPDYNTGWRGSDPVPQVEMELTLAGSKSYEELLSNHINDLSSLLGRVTINLGETDSTLLALPTDERLKRYSGMGGLVSTPKGDNVDAKAFDNVIRQQQSTIDPDLEELMFFYGRYLLASCSRPGGLPANLQGLWNDSNTPAWASDYHNNINIQMNYWAAESTNLSECTVPLIDFIDNCRPSSRLATQKAFGYKTRGWTARTSQNIFGGNGWEWNIPASAWYAQHVYEHWAFTTDTIYLKTRAYPMVKEICEYWEDRLKSMPDGTLMVPDGWSPEHGPREDGIMHDQQLVWDLFQNYLDMAVALNQDKEYQLKVADMQAHLAPNKIGKWGQLQEWQTDRDDPDDQHRHSSHLFAVYPGRQISITQTPDLAKAAILSLRSRSGNYGKNGNTPFTVESTVGDSRRSWTWPWRCAVWARLGEGERSGIMLRGLLTYNTLPNLFCNHPPFQLDGNFGISAAMAEMLLQSQTGIIQLLPAIPLSWAAKGSYTGLKARGGFTVDCSWENGKVITYNIRSEFSSKVKVYCNGEIVEIQTNKM